MFKNFKPILIGILTGVVLIAMGARAYNVFASPAASTSTSTLNDLGCDQGNGKGYGGTGGIGGSGGVEMQLIESIPTSNLSSQEAAGLLFICEEEKLARDVYNQLYTLWGQRVFQNIASSEQTHMDQIKVLMDRYALTDPALVPGQFTDPNLQALYDQLIAQGSVSLTEALKVGALIEQTDINDLESRLAQTDNTDIQLVYNNLMSASYNHLSAFTTGGGQGSNGQDRHRRQMEWSWIWKGKHQSLDSADNKCIHPRSERW